MNQISSNPYNSFKITRNETHRDKAKDFETFDSCIKNSDLPDSFKQLLKEYGTEIMTFQMWNFKRNIDLISRFSFRTSINQAI